MARTPRYDTPGSWHHIMNRGIARRPVFERQADVRKLLAEIAWSVRRGELELHAYSLLTTHFHLLVRSPSGCVSEGLPRVQNGYVRWFNRRRRRDGPLFRGRFTSKFVESLTYRRTLVRYIDQNTPAARVSSSAERYPSGSAAHYVRTSGPPWLCRTWIDSEVAAATESDIAGRYRTTFGTPLAPSERELVDQRVTCRGSGPDPLDDLVGAAPDRVRQWMFRKSALADGTRPGLPLIGTSKIQTELEKGRELLPEWRIRRFGNRLDPWRVLGVWLLRQAAGLSQAEIAARLDIPQGSLTRLQRLHATLLEDDLPYREAALELALRCFR